MYLYVQPHIICNEGSTFVAIFPVRQKINPSWIDFLRGWTRTFGTWVQERTFKNCYPGGFAIFTSKIPASPCHSEVLIEFNRSWSIDIYKESEKVSQQLFRLWQRCKSTTCTDLGVSFLWTYSRFLVATWERLQDPEQYFAISKGQLQSKLAKMSEALLDFELGVLPVTFFYFRFFYPNIYYVCSDRIWVGLPQQILWYFYCCFRDELQ